MSQYLYFGSKLSFHSSINNMVIILGVQHGDDDSRSLLTVENTSEDKGQYLIILIQMCRKELLSFEEELQLYNIKRIPDVVINVNTFI